MDNSDGDYENFCKDMESLKVSVGLSLLFEFLVLAPTVFDCFMIF